MVTPPSRCEGGATGLPSLSLNCRSPLTPSGSVSVTVGLTTPNFIEWLVRYHSLGGGSPADVQDATSTATAAEASTPHNHHLPHLIFTLLLPLLLHAAPARLRRAQRRPAVLPAAMRGRRPRTTSARRG